MPLSRTEIFLYLIAAAVLFVLHIFFGVPDWLLIVLAICLGLMAWYIEEQIKIRQKAKDDIKQIRPKYVSPYAVSFDDTEVTVSLNGEKKESVAWEELFVIVIQIENEGFVDVPYWILGAKSGNCFYPSDAVGHEALSEQFEKRLPGYYSNATFKVIGEIMVATSGGAVVWERQIENAA